MADETSGTPGLDLRRIVVVGTSCTGKSTLAAQLAGTLDATCIDLDAIHFGPDWSTDPTEVFREKVARAVAVDRWVCAGNYSAVADLVWGRATTFVWLDMPFALTFVRACWRTLRRTLTRERVCGENRERWLAFLDRDWIPYWVVRTWGVNRRRFGAVVEQGLGPDVGIVVLRSRAEVAHFRRTQSPPPRASRTSASSARTASGST